MDYIIILHVLTPDIFIEINELQRKLGRKLEVFLAKIQMTNKEVIKHKEFIF